MHDWFRFIPGNVIDFAYLLTEDACFVIAFPAARQARSLIRSGELQGSQKRLSG
jgi:hypothetical protein